MPTKTERILSYLPGTFRASLPVSGQPSALYAVADSVGSDLLKGENSLAEIMQAHWVDFADLGAEWIVDLAKIAALYGLAPRDDESVEEFREHLKRFIRTFLEGTVTVQGSLRITAEALGLTIADSYEQLDTWWKRPSDELLTVEALGTDAAELILGMRSARVQGNAAQAAQIKGLPDLSGGADLRGAKNLYVQVDDAPSVIIDLLPEISPAEATPPEEANGEEATGEAIDPEAVPLEIIVDRINAASSKPIARAEGGRLVVASPTIGSTSRLEFEEGDQDASGHLLGLKPRIYRGQAARPARVTGTVNLSGSLDLHRQRYLRLVVDGVHTAEIDCGGETPAFQDLDGVVTAINTALGIEIADHDGQFLTLTSTTSGAASSIAFQKAAAQDAAERLFGVIAPVYLGRDERPATIASPFDLDGPIDLSHDPELRLRIDGGAGITIRVAGAQPAGTQLAEIIDLINAALGEQVARREGQRLRLVSPTSGTDSEIAILTPDEGDAALPLFDLPPRTLRGLAPTAARLVGKVDLSQSVNLMAQYLLRVRMDGGPWVTVDLRSHAQQPESALLNEIADSLEAALGDDTAADDGEHLILASNTLGGSSSIEVAPLEHIHCRRFVSRAIITGEAAEKVLGFYQAQARGTPSERARLVGQTDLSRGVDLRAARYLRFSIDGRPSIELDCAGRRPRATLIEEVTEKLNQALQSQFGADLASHDGQHLVLISPSVGEKSHIRFEAPTAQDALDLLGLSPGTVYGSGISSVRFTGIPDLSAGLDLPANAAIKLSVDREEPMQIQLTSAQAAHLSLSQLVITISLALGSGVADHDGKHIILSSRAQGDSSQLEFEVPSGAPETIDATQILFGFSAPRTYVGQDAQPAMIQVEKDLSGEHDLRLRRFLRIGIDSRSPVDIDLASQSEDPASVKLRQIARAINIGLKAEVASAEEDDFLKLQSPSAGPSSRIVLQPHTGGDARSLLFGSVAEIFRGSDPAPAVLTGETDLLKPLDLSQRGVLRLSVDNTRPVDIDLRGDNPAQVLRDEIVAQINTYFPGLASLTEDDRLVLTSPTSGENSSVEVLPLRYLEVIEYPQQLQEMQPVQLVHGEGWAIANMGAAETQAGLTLSAASGTDQPYLFNQTVGWGVRLRTSIMPGETAYVQSNRQGSLLVLIENTLGERRVLPSRQVTSGPLGKLAQVPTTSDWLLESSGDEPGWIALDNPFSQRLVNLSAKGMSSVSISVDESTFFLLPSPAHPGDGSPVRLSGRLQRQDSTFELQDTSGEAFAHLRAGPQIDLPAYEGLMVAASGLLWAGEPPLLIVESLDQLFDVALQIPGEVEGETYTGVTIGDDLPLYSLAWHINASSQPSKLVRAELWDKDTTLSLPRGRVQWRYLECDCDRYNQDYFDQATFAGGICRQPGVFNASRFANQPPESLLAVFASHQAIPSRQVQLSMNWQNFLPGAFIVNLPVDLPPRFGGRFNMARFNPSQADPEQYLNVAFEPEEDLEALVQQINQSNLIQAAVVGRVPVGWQASQVPFRQPRYLTLGGDDTQARIYLAEEGAPGLLEIKAKKPGDHGNAIAVAVRKVGPALYDMTITFEGGRFEVARQIARGPELPELVLDLLKAGPVGVLQAKAAGVRAALRREDTG